MFHDVANLHAEVNALDLWVYLLPVLHLQAIPSFTSFKRIGQKYSIIFAKLSEGSSELCFIIDETGFIKTITWKLPSVKLFTWRARHKIMTNADQVKLCDNVSSI
jgi:hypothetical protein